MLPELKTAIPGPRSRELSDRLSAHESRNITFLSPGFPVFWERAHGVNVWDVDGNRFLDLTSGFGVASLGYTPEPVVEAMCDQASALYHAMGDVHPTREKVELCERLSQWTFERWGVGSGKTILTNSGSEAVEAALKTAAIATGKRGVIAFRNSYHGLGYGALTVTGSPFFRERFAPQLADWAHFLPFPAEWEEIDSFQRREEIEAALRAQLAQGETGAILVEPIQGRGGEVVPANWFLPLLRKLADEYRAALIFDEIFTGFFRTGKRFACDHWGVVPDLVCLGKALTSGFPLAACVGRAAVMDAWPPSDGEALHTSTFLGNPLGCRMALAALAEMEGRDLESVVNRTSCQLRAVLQSLQSSGTPWGRLRGRGLMLGLEVVDASGNPDAARTGYLIESLLARGIILLGGSPQRHTLSFTPPFDLSEEEAAFVGSMLSQSNSDMADKQSKSG